MLLVPNRFYLTTVLVFCCLAFFCSCSKEPDSLNESISIQVGLDVEGHIFLDWGPYEVDYYRSMGNVFTQEGARADGHFGLKEQNDQLEINLNGVWLGNALSLKGSCRSTEEAELRILGLVEEEKTKEKISIKKGKSELDLELPNILFFERMETLNSLK